MLYKFCRFGFMQTSSKAYGIRFFQRYIKMHRVFVLSIYAVFAFSMAKNMYNLQGVGYRVLQKVEQWHENENDMVASFILSILIWKCNHHDYGSFQNLANRGFVNPVQGVGGVVNSHLVILLHFQTLMKNKTDFSLVKQNSDMSAICPGGRLSSQGSLSYYTHTRFDL